MTTRQVQEDTILWEPSEAFKDATILARYMRWLGARSDRTYTSYEELWAWSVRDLDGFWASAWEFFNIQATPSYTAVLGQRDMPGATWFTGAQLNYAEHIFRGRESRATALLAAGEVGPVRALKWHELEEQVAAAAAALRDLGIQQGDRVVAYLPNIPAAVIALLACASLGAIWSCCPPEFGAPGVRDRFAQLDPTVLIAVDGYTYNGTAYPRLETVRHVQQLLPSLKGTVIVPHLTPNPTLDGLDRVMLWSELLCRGAGASLSFVPVPADHPLWILFSSGTTGIPKALVHGHGGILLEHLKALALQSNLQPGDRYLSFTTTGWMMWNLAISTLLVGATPILYDGSPGYPNLHTLWRLAEETETTYMGISPGFIAACTRAGLHPAQDHDLSRLKSVRATGSPLPLEGATWVYERVKRDLWFVVSAGGTEVCSAFVGGSPLLPVRAGEMQCRYLGVDAQAYGEDGRPVLDRVGELVIRQPMPSMPLFFWGDAANRRYRDSYFARYPGVWQHGDWFRVTQHRGCVIDGRSDATINRHGVRMGTSDIYRVVDRVPGVVDSLVVEVMVDKQESVMVLFVVLDIGQALDNALEHKIKEHLRDDLSPRHVPDTIIAIPAVPRTRNGKKLEVPIRKILQGTPVTQAADPVTLSNPAALDVFVQLAQSWSTGTAGTTWAKSLHRAGRQQTDGH